MKDYHGPISVLRGWYGFTMDYGYILFYRVCGECGARLAWGEMSIVSAPSVWWRIQSEFQQTKMLFSATISKCLLKWLVRGRKYSPKWNNLRICLGSMYRSFFAHLHRSKYYETYELVEKHSLNTFQLSSGLHTNALPFQAHQIYRELVAEWRTRLSIFKTTSEWHNVPSSVASFKSKHYGQLNNENSACVSRRPNARRGSNNINEQCYN